MNNNRQHAIILNYIFSQHITKTEKQELEKWLEATPDRYTELEKLIKAKSIYSSIMQESILSHDYANIKKKIVKTKRRRTIIKIAAIYIGLIIASFSGYLFLNNNDDETWQLASTPKGKTSKILLPDSTQVTLAPNSKLFYPAHFNSSNRLVKLEGQAYFEVTHSGEKPFKVQTTYSTVKVLGTKFNIKAYQNETITSTLLLEGKVNVYFTNKTGHFINKQTLKPAQKCTYNHQTQTYKTITPDNLCNDLAWRENRIVFKNETFRDVANKIERFHNVVIHFENKPLPTKLITGEFRDETPSEILKTINQWINFNYEITNDTINIKTLPM